MTILTLRSDKPEAELGVYQDDTKLDYLIWESHKQLAEDIHRKIEELLHSQKKSWEDIDAIVCYKGPGSFTGLRIGLTVANAIAYSRNIPIIATTGDTWIEQGIQGLQNGHNDTLTLPEYGLPPHITLPKK